MYVCMYDLTLVGWLFCNLSTLVRLSYIDLRLFVIIWIKSILNIICTRVGYTSEFESKRVTFSHNLVPHPS